MIKHDYKPQNNQRLFATGRKFRLPEWLKHPYTIVFMASLIALLAFFLSDEGQQEQTQQFNITPVALEIDRVQQASVGEPDQPLESIEDSEMLLNQHSGQPNISGTEPNISTTDNQWSAPISIELNINEESGTAPAPGADQGWQQEAVKKGDNLSLIFKRIGLSPQWVYKVATLDNNTKMLKRLKPGEILEYQLDAQGALKTLKYGVDLQRTLYVVNENGQLRSRMESKIIEKRIAFAQGRIDDSLFAAGKKAGLTDSQVMQLANIFDWDIDFILDIRKGDTFSMIYEEEFLDGSKIANGAILAAEFVNQGKSYKAIRYTDQQGRSSYFTPKGLSMRKAFLRAPLKFSYISSSFKPRRFHPILKRWKAHNGIDYRAPKGTPIRAAGDGKVIASTYNKYNGKYVFIQHGQGIITKYLHMSRRAVSRGKRVKQGQVIGYVGMTGLAEAPHLHYEFVVNGVHRNPRTVKLPDAEPIASSEKQRFAATAKPLLEKLEQRKHLQQELQIAP